MFSRYRKMVKGERDNLVTVALNKVAREGIHTQGEADRQWMCLLGFSFG